MNVVNAGSSYHLNWLVLLTGLPCTHVSMEMALQLNKKLGCGNSVRSQTNLSNLCSIPHKLMRPPFSLDDERHFPLKNSSPPIYFCPLIIVPPQTSEPENYFSSFSDTHIYSFSQFYSIWIFTVTLVRVQWIWLFPLQIKHEIMAISRRAY